MSEPNPWSPGDPRDPSKTRRDGRGPTKRSSGVTEPDDSSKRLRIRDSAELEEVGETSRQTEHEAMAVSGSSGSESSQNDVETVGEAGLGTDESSLQQSARRGDLVIEVEDRELREPREAGESSPPEGRGEHRVAFTIQDSSSENTDEGGSIADERSSSSSQAVENVEAVTESLHRTQIVSTKQESSSEATHEERVSRLQTVSSTEEFKGTLAESQPRRLETVSTEERSSENTEGSSSTTNEDSYSRTTSRLASEIERALTETEPRRMANMPSLEGSSSENAEGSSSTTNEDSYSRTTSRLAGEIERALTETEPRRMANMPSLEGSSSENAEGSSSATNEDGSSRTTSSLTREIEMASYENEPRRMANMPSLEESSSENVEESSSTTNDDDSLRSSSTLGREIERALTKYEPRRMDSMPSLEESSSAEDKSSVNLRRLSDLTGETEVALIKTQPKRTETAPTIEDSSSGTAETTSSTANAAREIERALMESQHFEETVSGVKESETDDKEEESETDGREEEIKPSGNAEVERTANEGDNQRGRNIDTEPGTEASTSGRSPSRDEELDPDYVNSEPTTSDPSDNDERAYLTETDPEQEEREALSTEEVTQLVTTQFFDTQFPDDVSLEGGVLTHVYTDPTVPVILLSSSADKPEGFGSIPAPVHSGVPSGEAGTEESAGQPGIGQPAGQAVRIPLLHLEAASEDDLALYLSAEGAIGLKMRIWAHHQSKSGKFTLLEGWKTTIHSCNEYMCAVPLYLHKSEKSGIRIVSDLDIQTRIPKSLTQKLLNYRQKPTQLRDPRILSRIAREAKEAEEREKEQIRIINSMKAEQTSQAEGSVEKAAPGTDSGKVGLASQIEESAEEIVQPITVKKPESVSQIEESAEEIVQLTTIKKTEPSSQTKEIVSKIPQKQAVKKAESASQAEAKSPRKSTGKAEPKSPAEGTVMKIPQKQPAGKTGPASQVGGSGQAKSPRKSVLKAGQAGQAEQSGQPSQAPGTGMKPPPRQAVRKVGQASQAEGSKQPTQPVGRGKKPTPRQTVSKPGQASQAEGSDQPSQAVGRGKKPTPRQIVSKPGQASQAEGSDQPSQAVGRGKKPTPRQIVSKPEQESQAEGSERPSQAVGRGKKAAPRQAVRKPGQASQVAGRAQPSQAAGRGKKPTQKQPIKKAGEAGQTEESRQISQAEGSEKTPTPRKAVGEVGQACEAGGSGQQEIPKLDTRRAIFMECPICKKICYTAESFTVHGISCTPYRWVCKFCNSQFISSRLMDKHYFQVPRECRVLKARKEPFTLPDNIVDESRIDRLEEAKNLKDAKCVCPTVSVEQRFKLPSTSQGSVNVKLTPIIRCPLHPKGKGRRSPKKGRSPGTRGRMGRVGSYAQIPKEDVEASEQQQEIQQEHDSGRLANQLLIHPTTGRIIPLTGNAIISTTEGEIVGKIPLQPGTSELTVLGPDLGLTPNHPNEKTQSNGKDICNKVGHVYQKIFDTPSIQKKIKMLGPDGKFVPARNIVQESCLLRTQPLEYLPGVYVIGTEKKPVPGTSYQELNVLSRRTKEGAVVPYFIIDKRVEQSQSVSVPAEEVPNVEQVQESQIQESIPEIERLEPTQPIQSAIHNIAEAIEQGDYEFRIPQSSNSNDQEEEEDSQHNLIIADEELHSDSSNAPADAPEGAVDSGDQRVQKIEGSETANQLQLDMSSAVELHVPEDTDSEHQHRLAAEVEQLVADLEDFEQNSPHGCYGARVRLDENHTVTTVEFLPTAPRVFGVIEPDRPDTSEDNPLSPTEEAVRALLALQGLD